MYSNLRTYRTMGDGISQEELANMAGTTRETINRIERGKHVPSLETALRICAALGDALGQPVHVEDVWQL